MGKVAFEPTSPLPLQKAALRKLKKLEDKK
jgi:hypothetical protein